MTERPPREFNAPVPLPPLTHRALVSVYHARRLSRRTLSKAVSTTHPHIGRIVSNTSRPSAILSQRLGDALDLPDEFITLLVSHSSTVGRKMRHPGADRHEFTVAVGDEPCPVTLARCHRFMHDALADPHEGIPELAPEFESRLSVWSVGVWPAMDLSPVIRGLSLDPWHEFKAADTVPLAVWRGDPTPPLALTSGTVAEFIASIPLSSMVRCTHHA